MIFKKNLLLEGAMKLLREPRDASQHIAKLLEATKENLERLADARGGAACAPEEFIRHTYMATYEPKQLGKGCAK